MSGKPHGERIATLEAYYVEVNDSLKEINKRLGTLNSQVSKNSDFRLQQKTVYGVIGVAWGTASV
ncbi:hypothetical protein LCGC14_2623550, partial [marine sediment metagenome]